MFRGEREAALLHSNSRSRFSAFPFLDRTRPKEIGGTLVVLGDGTTAAEVHIQYHGTERESCDIKRMLFKGTR